MIESTNSQIVKEGRIIVGPLNESGLVEAMRLKAQAGWNQTERDWRRLFTLGRCFAAYLDNRVIGTVTTITFGRELAWIGMMLIDPDYHRRGLGTRLMGTALAHLQGIGVVSIKLDATPAGRPLYASLGFSAVGLIERWEGVGRSAAGKDLEKFDESNRPAVYALDRRAYGVDRRAVLDTLITESPVPPLIARDPVGQMEGFALAREGSRAFYVGPIAARTKETALGLLEGMLDQLTGERIYLDINTGFGLGPKVLDGRGFVKQRDLTRMRFGQGGNPGTSKLVLAISGPELG